MTRRAPLHTLALSMLLAVLTCTQFPAPVLAQPGDGHGKNNAEKSVKGRNEDQRQDSVEKRGKGHKQQQGQSFSPQQAAEQARAKYGGQVLKVSPSGRGYQVRLLKDDGRVMTVSIGD